MKDEERERIESLIKELPASISDFLTAFDIVTDGIDFAMKSFLTTADEKILLRQLLNRLHDARDRIILENYILNQTSSDCCA